MPLAGAHDRIRQEVASWPQVTASPHRFGGTEFSIGRREIGHIHGDSFIDIPFPTAVRQELVEAGEAEPHHLLSGSGWVTFYLRIPDDIPRAVDLLRRSYSLALVQQARRNAQTAHDNLDAEAPNLDT